MDSNLLIDAVTSVTKDWAAQRKREERSSGAVRYRRENLVRIRRMTIKDAAETVIPAAYLKASGGGRLPAHARQVMYAARGKIQEMTGRTLDDVYFTQVLLPDYIRDHGEASGWDVVFDARGNLIEPHTKRTVPLGTLHVRKYLRELTPETLKLEKSGGGELPDYIHLPSTRVPTTGPGLRYGAILFIEKEGFLPLLKQVRLAERYDIAIMSTKGMSNTASRHLVESMCSASWDGIPLLVVHDFDKAGFSILGTLQRDTRRYEFGTEVKVIDLGLRLKDVQDYDLVSEEVSCKGKAARNLRENGATKDEIAYLLEGQRVELNAFASDQFVEWLEGKLEEHGIEKVVPDEQTLATAYRRTIQVAAIRRAIQEAWKGAGNTDDATVPEGLRERVLEALEDDPGQSWDDALWDIASGGEA